MLACRGTPCRARVWVEQSLQDRETNASQRGTVKFLQAATIKSWYGHNLRWGAQRPHGLLARKIWVSCRMNTTSCLAWAFSGSLGDFLGILTSGGGDLGCWVSIEKNWLGVQGGACRGVEDGSPRIRLGWGVAIRRVSRSPM